MAAQLGHVHVQAPIKVELEITEPVGEDGKTATSTQLVETTPGRVIFNTVHPGRAGLHQPDHGPQGRSRR